MINPDYFTIAQQKNIGMWPKVLPTQGVVHYVNRMKGDVTGAITRVYKGEDAFNLLSSCPRLTALYGIDSYMPYKEGDIDRNMEDVEQYNVVRDVNLADHAARYHHYPKSIRKAYSMLDPMDFIFIDLHGEELVEEALECLHDKVKPKGSVFVANIGSSMPGVKAFRKKQKVTLPMHILKIEQVVFWSKT